MADRLPRGHSDSRRDDNLRHRFGLTIDQYNELLASQGGVCAVCGKPETNEIRGRVLALAVDHDRLCCPGRSKCRSECVRGLVCNACNRAMGLMGDDPARLRAAADYLGRYTHLSISSGGR